MNWEGDRVIHASGERLEKHQGKCRYDALSLSQAILVFAWLDHLHPLGTQLRDIKVQNLIGHPVALVWSWMLPVLDVGIPRLEQAQSVPNELVKKGRRQLFDRWPFIYFVHENAHEAIRMPVQDVVRSVERWNAPPCRLEVRAALASQDQFQLAGEESGEAPAYRSHLCTTHPHLMMRTVRGFR